MKKNLHRVNVLMSTYNGENYLEEQLESIFKQIDVDVLLFVRDDGSKDKTVGILEKWASEYPIKIIRGQNAGVCKSFMELIFMQEKLEDSYFAFCDQDDVWEPEKLKAACEMLDQMDSKKPAVYYSNYKVVDKDLNCLHVRQEQHKTSFLSAMLQGGYALGCTMVFNAEAVRLAQELELKYVSMHDAWIARICYAVGNVCFDPNAYLLYRQHGGNVIGANRSLVSSIKRRGKSVTQIVNGSKSRFLSYLYECCYPLMDDERKKRELFMLVNYRNDWRIKRQLLFSGSIKMGTKVKTGICKVLILLNRI